MSLPLRSFRRAIGPAIAFPTVGTLSARRRRRVRQFALVATGVLLATFVLGGVSSTGALFSDADSVANTLSTKRIFSGARVTSAFVVKDASGGSEVDRTSPFAVVGDGRTVTTTGFGTSFAAGRYVQFDLSAPLPGALSVASPMLRFTFASAGVSATACVYLDVRQISTNSVVATYGSSGSPLGCVTGTSLTTLTQSLPIVGGTDTANDLRIRIYGSDSGANGMQIDEARFTGSTPYAAFSLYPVRFTDAASGSPLTTPWDLQGP